MSLSIGIVGLPNVGKSTLFNALTDAGVLAANYPFATIEPNTGVVPIPDPRVEHLASIFGSKRTIPATVTFVDIAGLVRGASEGEGLGNRFLANIRDVNAICHVVRAFDSDNVVHVGSDSDPAGDIEVIETELALADLETIDKRLPRLEKEATIDRSLAPRVEALRRLREMVGVGRDDQREGGRSRTRVRRPSPAHRQAGDLRVQLRSCHCSAMPARRSALSELVAPAAALFLDAQLEADLNELSGEERLELLESVGQAEPGLNSVIRAAYQALGLQSFLTVGEKEARAWTVRSGATAPEAAGVIHTDFQRGFIAAEVIDYPLLVETGSWVEARARGLVRTEGKAYLMRPDDVVEFRFNV